MSYLLDPNFYISIPLWVYAFSGLGCVNITLCFCYWCFNRKNTSMIKIKELELERLEMELDKRFELEQREKDLERRKKALDKEYEGITLTRPSLYSEMA